MVGSSKVSRDGILASVAGIVLLVFVLGALIQQAAYGVALIPLTLIVLLFVVIFRLVRSS